MQTLIFEQNYIAQTVKELRERVEIICEALADIDDTRKAFPLEKEALIISQTLAAIDLAYGHDFFDKNESGELYQIGFSGE